MVGDLETKGFTVFDPDEATLTWAAASLEVSKRLAADLDIQNANLRHGKTWFVGVDVLPNASDGAIEGVPLKGPWQDHIEPPAQWHRAQLSIVYPGYPKQDVDESEGNHRYRITRFAAHVDGLLPMGPDRRRFMQEPHGFILGLPLNQSNAAPLMVWPGSHKIMGQAFRAEIGKRDPKSVDITEVYHAARREVFDRITPRSVAAAPGQSILFHRHLLHGVGVWGPQDTAPPEGRMIAYFRPEIAPSDWLEV